MSGEPDEGELPYWHEVEVGAPRKRLIEKRKPEDKRPPFPAGRWPKEGEARLLGYHSVKEWYLHWRKQSHRAGHEFSSRSTVVTPTDKELEIDFEELQNRYKAAGEEEEEDGETEGIPPVDQQDDEVHNVEAPQLQLGTSETGRTLTAPYQFEGPLVWKRVCQYEDKRRELERRIEQKWEEATTGPPRDC